MFSEYRVYLHDRTQVTIIDAVKRIEFYRVSLEVSRQKSCVDAVVRLLALPLNIMQKHREMRCVNIGQAVVQELVNEYLVQPVLAGGLY